jgi:hypothetical protein
MVVITRPRLVAVQHDVTILGGGVGERAVDASGRRVISPVAFWWFRHAGSVNP